MKVFYTFLLILPILKVQAQDNIFGRYKNYFGSEIALNPDSTFAYSYHFDMTGTWTVGNYKIVKDTIFLIEVPVYDTLQFGDKHNTPLDSLVFSDDDKAERVTMDEYAHRPLLSSAQDRMPHPALLIWRKKRLYTLNGHGKIRSRKIKALSNGKKYVPWYRKEA